MHTAGTISFRIWMAAILTNTLIGTAWITGFQSFDTVGFLFFGFIASALFSLPVYLAVGILIAKCRATGMSGGKSLCLVYAVGIACTALIHCCFTLLVFDDLFIENTYLFGLNMLSAVVGISVQAHRIYKISAVEPE